MNASDEGTPEESVLSTYYVFIRGKNTDAEGREFNWLIFVGLYFNLDLCSLIRLEEIRFLVKEDCVHELDLRHNRLGQLVS